MTELQQVIRQRDELAEALAEVEHGLRVLDGAWADDDLQDIREIAERSLDSLVHEIGTYDMERDAVEWSTDSRRFVVPRYPTVGWARGRRARGVNERS